MGLIELACVAIVTGGALVYGITREALRHVLERDAPELVTTRALFAEKRRVLERDRSEWLHSPRSQTRGEEMTRIDRMLLELADEESKAIMIAAARSGMTLDP